MKIFEILFLWLEKYKNWNQVSTNENIFEKRFLESVYEKICMKNLESMFWQEKYILAKIGADTADNELTFDSKKWNLKAIIN